MGEECKYCVHYRNSNFHCHHCVHYSEPRPYSDNLVMLTDLFEFKGEKVTINPVREKKHNFEIADDGIYRYEHVEGCDPNIVRKVLVMDKEAFIEAYDEWIAKRENWVFHQRYNVSKEENV